MFDVRRSTFEVPSVRAALTRRAREHARDVISAWADLVSDRAALGAAFAEVTRHPLPGSDFPIAQAVEVTPDTTIVYHSGTIPDPANPDAERFSPEFWGDTET